MGENAPEKLVATNPGEFTVTANNKVYLANEPVKYLNFGTATRHWFTLPAYDYEGFATIGTKVRNAARSQRSLVTA